MTPPWSSTPITASWRCTWTKSRCIPCGQARRSLLRTPGCTWTLLPLYREDAERRVRVVLTPVYANNLDQEVEFLLGSSLAIYTSQLRLALPELMLSLGVTLTGILLLCAAAWSRLTGRTSSALFSTGMLAIAVGLWRLTDTRFSPFLWESRPVLLLCVSLCMLMICMIPLLQMARSSHGQAGRRWLDGLCIIISLSGLVQLMVQLLGMADLRQMLTVTHVLIILSTMLITVLNFAQPFRGQRPEQNRILRHSAEILGFGALADLAVYSLTGNSAGLLFFLLSILIYSL